MCFCFLTQRRVIKAFAGIPATIVAGLGIGCHFLQRSAKTELQQDARGVRRNLNSCAHLTKRGSLLEQTHIDSAFAQGEHTGNATYAAANDKNFHTGHKRPTPICS